MKNTQEAPAFSFREGEYLLTLTADGVKFTGEDEEFWRPYSEVKLYRAIARKRVKDIGREKLYLTAPFPVPRGYNRYAFKEDGETYRTHVFTEEERSGVEQAIAQFEIPVIDRRKSAEGIIKPPIKSFCDDGGIARRVVMIALLVFVSLLIGALIMYLINYFLHTDTGALALVFAIFCLPCAAVVIIKSQELGSRIKIYEEGVQLKIRRKSGYGSATAPFAVDKVFFNWDEVECVERVQSQVQYQVLFRLGHSVITVPDFNGLYEYLQVHFPEVCKVDE